VVQVSKFKQYMEEKRLSYAKIANILDFDVAYVYRVLNKKGNTHTKHVKPSDKFLTVLKAKLPELYRIVKEELSS